VNVFGERVLRVRLCRDAPRWISITAQLAASELRAQGLRVVVDDVPAGYRDGSNWSWTEDLEVAEVLRLWAGGDADDPVPAQMVVAGRWRSTQRVGVSRGQEAGVDDWTTNFGAPMFADQLGVRRRGMRVGRADLAEPSTHECAPTKVRVALCGHALIVGDGDTHGRAAISAEPRRSA